MNRIHNTDNIDEYHDLFENKHLHRKISMNIDYYTYTIELLTKI